MNEADHIPVEGRISKAIEALVACAEEHETRGSDENYRCSLVADLMSALGLELFDIGFIAELWLERNYGEEPPDDPQDGVLDANEISN